MFSNEKTMQEEFFGILKDFLRLATILPKEASDPFRKIILDKCGKISTLEWMRLIDEEFNEDHDNQLIGE